MLEISTNLYHLLRGLTGNVHPAYGVIQTRNFIVIGE
jgi:hypothetical protein